jgi:hypothetical protein
MGFLFSDANALPLTFSGFVVAGVVAAARSDVMKRFGDFVCAG